MAVHVYVRVVLVHPFENRRAHSDIGHEVAESERTLSSGRMAILPVHDIFTSVPNLCIGREAQSTHPCEASRTRFPSFACTHPQALTGRSAISRLIESYNIYSQQGQKGR